MGQLRPQAGGSSTFTGGGGGRNSSGLAFCFPVSKKACHVGLVA